MKRIIMFVLLFAALKVAGQTTGYLRYDTVRIMKQNGTCELYIINKTKDSLGLLTNVGGGLTRFIKPKMLNDSSIIIGLDTVVIRGASGGRNISNASLTANGDYLQDWAHHWFFLNNLKALNINSNRTDPVYPGNKKTFSFYSDSTANAYPLWLKWSLRNMADNQDSLGGDLTFSKNSLQLNNFDGNAYATVYASGNQFFPNAQIFASDGSTQSVLTVGATTIFLDAHDSTRVKLVPAATADSVVALRSLGFGLNTLLKVPMPSGGSATLSNVGSGYRLVKTAGGQVKTTFAGWGTLKDSTSNTDGITDKVDSATLKTAFVPLHLPANKTVRQYGFNMDFTGGRVSADSLRLPAVNAKAIPDSIVAFGHSIMQGLNATDQAHQFIDIVANFYDLHLKNLGNSGKGIWYSAATSYSYLDTGNRAASFSMSCLNDLRRAGNDPKARYQCINGYKAMFVSQNLKYWEPAGTGANVTRYGTWSTNYASSTIGGKGVGNGAYTQATNDSIVWVSPVTTSLGVGTFGADSSDGVSGFYNHSKFDWYIDGVLQQADVRLNGNASGITDGAYDNRRSPFVVFKTGLANTTHTVKLVNKGNGYFPVDYFGTLIDTTQALPFVIFDEPHLDATGYATSPANATDAVIDSFNVRTDSLIAALPPGYRAYKVHTNNTYDVSTGLAVSDHIHPNDVGHQQIADQATGELPNIVDPGGSDGTIYNVDRFYGVVGNLRKTFAFLEDNDFIRNRISADQSAGFRVNQQSTVNNIFNTNATTQGAGANPLLKPVALGTLGATDIPFYSWRNVSGSAKKKNADMYYQDGKWVLRAIDDGNSESTMIMEANGSSDSTENIKFHSRHLFADNIPFLSDEFLGEGYDTLMVWDPTFKEVQRIKVPFATKEALSDTAAALRAIAVGINSINGETGASQTISSGTGIVVSTSPGSNTHSVGINSTYLNSNTFSPTLTGDANVDGTPTALHATYTRVNNIVTCYVTVSVDPTANATQTEVGITLPISSNFTDSNDLSGTGSGSAGNGAATFVLANANTSSDRATLIFQSGSTSASIVTLTFRYIIL